MIDPALALDRGRGELVELLDGTLVALCPDCGRDSVVGPIEVEEPVEEAHTMYLSCDHCRAPYHVRGNFYRLRPGVEPR